MTEWTPTLPGLDLSHSGGPGSTAMHDAAVATLQALDTEGLLEARHALTCQAVLQLSRSLDAGLNTGRVSVATSTLVKHLLEAYSMLPEPAESTVDAALEEMLAKFAQAGGQ